MKLLKQIFKTSFIFLASVGIGTNATAQCEGFSNYPGGEQEGKKQHVLYRDYVKQKKYADAYPLWEKVFTHSPAGSEKHFIDGIKIYKSLMKGKDVAKDQKQTYIDKMIKLYDQRIECFGEKKTKAGNPKKGSILGRKAYDMYFLQTDASNLLKMFQESVQLEGNNTQYYILDPYAHTAIKLFKDEKIDAEVLRQLHKQLNEIADNNLESEKYGEKFKSAKSAINERFDEPYVSGKIFDCEYFKAKYQPIYESDKTNRENRQMVLKALTKAGCDKTDPLVAEIFEKEKDVLEKEALGRRTPRTWGNIAYKEGNFEEALTKYKEHLDYPSASDEEKADVALLMAKIYYGKKKQRSKAREYARKSAKFNPNSGKPYLLIGEMYASSGPLCGKGTGWESQVVVWAAMDQWNRAKSDPSCSAKANKLIGQYRQYMPTKSDGFMRGVKSGQSFKIKCWIQESTTARFSK